MISCSVRVLGTPGSIWDGIVILPFQLPTARPAVSAVIERKLTKKSCQIPTAHASAQSERLEKRWESSRCAKGIPVMFSKQTPNDLRGIHPSDMMTGCI